MSSSSSKFEKLAVVTAAVLALITIIFTGYVKSYLDEEIQTTVFLKKFPTFQMKFFDPFANEGDDIPISELTKKQKIGFADYCKYRFGLTDTSDEGLEFCKKNISSYLGWRVNPDNNRDMLFQWP